MTKAARGSVALYFYHLGGVGGAQRMVSLLADALAARGFEVHLVSWDPVDAESFYRANCSVTRHRFGYHKGWVDKARRALSLARLLRRERIQVLVGFVMSGDKTIYAAAKLAGVHLIAAERNAPEMYHLRYGRAKRWLNFSLLHFVDRITVQMPEFACGYPSSLQGRIEVIPNPVPIPRGRAEPSRLGRNGRFTLLAVSRFDGVQKRLDRLVGAFARIAAAHRDWDLRIIGDGPERTNLRRLAGELGLGTRVKFEPTASDIFNAYVEAHLFAIPSLWEGFPNALAEAMSHGLPAVGFEGASGVAQLIEDGESGWLAKGLDDEVMLATALNQAMSNPAERFRRGQIAARSMAAYAPEVQFDRWTTLLETLVSEPHR